MADITCILLRHSFRYLAADIDAFSHRCVGWHLTMGIDTHLIVAALEMAITTRDVRPCQINRSDRAARRQRVPDTAFERNHASPRQLGNARAESLLETLSAEEGYLNAYRGFADARESSVRFIADVNNQERPHSSPGCRISDEFERSAPTGTATA